MYRLALTHLKSDKCYRAPHLTSLPTIWQVFHTPSLFIPVPHLTLSQTIYFVAPIHPLVLDCSPIRSFVLFRFVLLVFLNQTLSRTVMCFLCVQSEFSPLYFASFSRFNINLLWANFLHMRLFLATPLSLSIYFSMCYLFRSPILSICWRSSLNARH